MTYIFAVEWVHAQSDFEIGEIDIPAHIDNAYSYAIELVSPKKLVLLVKKKDRQRFLDIITWKVKMGGWWLTIQN